MNGIHPDQLLVLLLVAIGALAVPVGLFGVPLWKRWKRNLERGDADDRSLRGEVEELRGRVSELEERLDFSERLLTQVKEGHLPGEVK